MSTYTQTLPNLYFPSRQDLCCCFAIHVCLTCLGDLPVALVWRDSHVPHLLQKRVH